MCLLLLLLCWILRALLRTCVSCVGAAKDVISRFAVVVEGVDAVIQGGVPGQHQTDKVEVDAVAVVLLEALAGWSCRRLWQSSSQGSFQDFRVDLVHYELDFTDTGSSTWSGCRRMARRV